MLSCPVFSYIGGWGGGCNGNSIRNLYAAETEILRMPSLISVFWTFFVRRGWTLPPVCLLCVSVVSARAHRLGECSKRGRPMNTCMHACTIRVFSWFVWCVRWSYRKSKSCWRTQNPSVLVKLSHRVRNNFAGLVRLNWNGAYLIRPQMHLL